MSGKPLVSGAYLTSSARLRNNNYYTRVLNICVCRRADRVSFGSHKSMVETLIIDVVGDQVSQAERNFYRQNLLSDSDLSLPVGAGRRNSARHS